MASDALSALKNNKLFAPIPDSDFGLLLDGHRVLNVAEDAVLFRDGDTATELFLILRGAVTLLPPPSGGSAQMPIHLAHGDTAGEEAVLSGMPYCATARTTAPTTVMAIPARVFIGYLESHFDMAIAMISTMAASLRERVREITELKMQSTAERLAGFLLSLAGAATGRIVVRLPYEKRQLADQLGMDPATLSRAFAKLRDQGVVASRTDKVEIQDVTRLRSYGDGASFST